MDMAQTEQREVAGAAVGQAACCAGVAPAVGNQSELFVLSVRDAPHKIAVRMLDILLAEGRWITRARFGKEYDLDPRECRVGRQYSRGRIISGQAGYKAAACATVEELTDAARVLHSMAVELFDEERDLWKILHGNENRREIPV